MFFPSDFLQRMDLGECPKVHDHALRADFEAASKERDYFYDIDAMEHLDEFITDCDRRTEIAKKKLKETQDDLTEEATAKVSINIATPNIHHQLFTLYRLCPAASGRVVHTLELFSP